MNRRNFLRLLAGGAAGAVAAPSVKYFLPPAGGWDKNRFMSVDYGFEPSQSVLTLIDHDRIIYLGAMCRCALKNAASA